MSPRRSSKSAVPGAASGVALHEAAERVTFLLLERARLLRDVQKKKLQLEQARQKASREADEATAKMAPVIARHQAVLGALTAVFDELLAPDRLSKRARAQVLKVRRSLELQGVLPPLGDKDFWDDDDYDAEPWHETDGGAEGPHSRPARSANAAPPEVAAARQVGQERRSLRELFRNLARAVHPDRARHDAERERRTEVMKEVTRAYEDGDLARLLELESTWKTEQAVSSSGDSVTRCLELERVNRELLTQVRALTRELRDTKREARDALDGTADELVAQASLELDVIEQICLFIGRFRDGKISLAELSRGPLTY